MSGMATHTDARQKIVSPPKMAKPGSAMRRVAHYMPSPGGSNERLQVFVGQADLSGAGGIHGVADEGEDIRVVVQPVSAIESLLQSGRVDNAASLITLQWLLLNREALDREWRP